MTLISPSFIFTKTVGTDPAGCASSDSITVDLGAEVVYCYQVENTGSITIPMHDLVDDQLGTILDDFSHDLGIGGTTFVTQSVVLTQTTVNSATWTGFDLGYAISESDVATVTVRRPDLVINKTAAPTTSVTYRGEVTYTITLANSGLLDASNVQMSDTLPLSTTFARWVEQPSGGSLVGLPDVITWTGALSVGETITFTFVVSHTGDYGDQVTNTALFTHLSGNGSDGATFTVEGQNLGVQIYLPVVIKN
jgi:uncharacterized repeat protein (TIGR01451 family)